MRFSMKFTFQSLLDYFGQPELWHTTVLNYECNSVRKVASRLRIKPGEVRQFMRKRRWYATKK